MEKRRMEKLGIEPSLLGFGCMRFPVSENGKIDEAAAEKMVDEAMARGVTYYDTAYPYHDGDSEVFIGRVLNKYPRSDYFLATKLPIWLVERREQVREIFEEQLRKLDKEYVDFYLVHAMDRERLEQLKRIDVLGVLEELRQEGKLRYIGFSFHDDYDVFEEIVNFYDWDFCQIQYNYMDTEEQAGDRGYKLTEEKGIPLIIMEPVRGGMLAGFSEEIEGIFRAYDPEKSIASWALRWVASHPNVKVVLSGMSDQRQVEDNLNTFGDFQPLSREEEDVIHKVVKTMRERMQNGCTGCRYCMPCPAGVQIPASFRMWNDYHIYQSYSVVRNRWENMPQGERPLNCVECGACEAKCPQKLPIREHLKAVQRELDAPEWK